MSLDRQFSEEDLWFLNYSSRMGRAILLDPANKLPRLITDGVLYKGYVRGFLGHEIDVDFLQSLKDGIHRVAYKCAYKHGREDNQKRLATSSSTSR